MRMSKMVAPFLSMKGIALAASEPGASDGSAPAGGRLRLVAGAAARTASGFFAMEASLDDMEAARAEWADLAHRALEPNAFFEPGFALSAARHFPISERPRFILVRDGAGALAGLFPIVMGNSLTGDGLARLWLHKQAALATPLVAQAAAVEILQAFLDWMAANSRATGVAFSSITADGRFRAALDGALAASGRSGAVLESHARAALLPGGDANATFARAGSKKTLAEVRRQARRLREMGRVAFETHETVDGVKAAAEEFLALEASGWKAGRGALLSQPALATFLRCAARLLAADGRCKIHALRLDGRPVAMAVAIESQGRSYLWKIAYDEKLRAQAPGVQLVHGVTRACLDRADLELVDSCAIANHPMIDRLWPDRIGVCDVAASLRRGGEADFRLSCRRDQVRRRLKALAKRAASGLLKRKAS
jgi:CelD/BcsL family acetyltransferase involved in cellulose biosynthesis